jgi:hypothetical protein
MLERGRSQSERGFGERPKATQMKERERTKLGRTEEGEASPRSQRKKRLLLALPFRSLLFLLPHSPTTHLFGQRQRTVETLAHDLFGGGCEADKGNVSEEGQGGVAKKREKRQLTLEKKLISCSSAPSPGSSSPRASAPSPCSGR